MCYFLEGVVEHFVNNGMFSEDIFKVLQNCKRRFCNGGMQKRGFVVLPKFIFIYIHSQRF